MKFKLLKVLVLIFTIFVFSTNIVMTKESEYSINGNIYNVENLDDKIDSSTKLFLDEISIKLFKNNELLEIVTCKSGKYEFNNLKAGEYDLEFSLLDKESYEFVYNENFDNILVNTVSLNNNEILNILVSKKPDTSSTFPKTNFIKYFMVLLYTLLSLLIIFLVVKNLKYRKYKYK